MIPMNFNRMSSNVRSSPLSNDELRRVAPAIFAPSAHQSRSARYVYISTEQMLERFRDAGFYPYSASAARIRKSADQSRVGFQRHLIRFRRPVEGEIAPGGTIPEVIMLNAHDGTSSYELMGGMFRCVCANGLIVADSVYGAIRVHHSGKVLDNLVEGALEIAAQSDSIAERVATMQARVMNMSEIRDFTLRAMETRFGDPVASPSWESISRPRRSEDTASTLWNVFNRAQESLIRGGNTYWLRDDEGRIRHMRTRPIKGIQQTVAVNRRLWALAEEYSKAA